MHERDDSKISTSMKKNKNSNSTTTNTTTTTTTIKGVATTTTNTNTNKSNDFYCRATCCCLGKDPTNYGVGGRSATTLERTKSEIENK